MFRCLPSLQRLLSDLSSPPSFAGRSREGRYYEDTLTPDVPTARSLCSLCGPVSRPLYVRVSPRSNGHDRGPGAWGAVPPSTASSHGHVRPLLFLGNPFEVGLVLRPRRDLRVRPLRRSGTARGSANATSSTPRIFRGSIAKHSSSLSFAP